MLANGTEVAPVIDANGCNQVQVFYHGRCLQRIPDCVLYQENGLCQYCSDKYRVNVFGTCSERGFNLRCEPGFWLDRANDKCQKVDISCDWYFDDTGKCFNCSIGYVFEGADCVPNRTCNSQQFFFQGTCIDVPTSCIDFSPIDGTCFACDRGFTLIDGFCSLSLNFINRNNCEGACKTCLSYNKLFCFSCNRGYHLTNGRYGTCAPFPF